jgi:aspartate carbamoyltransferase catalytic subunit
MKHTFVGRHLIEPGDFTAAEMAELFDGAEKIEADPGAVRDAARGRLLATLFFEPSTRTRLSFEAAMLRLGGSCLGFADPKGSSVVKGESLADTIRMAASYADAIVMRNPKEGAALVASRYSSVSVVNAGDGGHHHPTQTLTDLMTIRRRFGAFEGLTVGFCGDLMFGRTVHSLATALARYAGVRLIFISPKELQVPEYITGSVLSANNVQFFETDRLEKVLGDLDVLYMTRVQKERFINEEDYERLKDSYVLTPEKMHLASPEMIVMHPLPRVNEIAATVDEDSRAWYFRQAKYGMYVRMALLAALLGVL